MGRKSKMPVGSVAYGFEVIETVMHYKGTNRLVLLKCVECGTVREAWNTSYRIGKVRCVTCNTAEKQLEKRITDNLPFVAVYPDRAVIIYDRTTVLEGNPVTYRFLDGSTAIPTPYSAKDANTVPEPDQGYFYHLIVPAEWVDFYCELGDLSDVQNDLAMAYYAEHVYLPTPAAYSTNLKGSGQTWRVGGETFGYIYWRDHNTWPKSYPAPEAKTSIIPAAPLIPRPEPVFYDLKAPTAPPDAWENA